MDTNAGAFSLVLTGIVNSTDLQTALSHIESELKGLSCRFEIIVDTSTFTSADQGYQYKKTQDYTLSLPRCHYKTHERYFKHLLSISKFNNIVVADYCAAFSYRKIALLLTGLKKHDAVVFGAPSPGNFLVSKFNRLLIGSSKHIWPHLIAANKQTLLLHPNLKLKGNLILSLFHTAKYSRSDISIIHDSDLPAAKISRLKLFQRISWHRLFHPRIFHFKSGQKSGAIGSGYVHRGRRYVIHTDLSHSQSAVNTFILPQKIVLVFVAASLFYLLIFHFWSTAIIFVAVLTSIYFIDVLFNLYLIVKSLH
ncbi:MAG TPA: hypothetical protein VF828_00875, partial [Patescibacteria group bacterium]